MKMENILTFVASVVGIVVFIAVGARFLESRLLYVPMGARVDPARIGLEDVREHELITNDGHRIIMWYRSAISGQPTILYFHGNGGSLADRVDRFVSFGEKGRGVLMMSYRGYSGSSGTPSEAANVADAKLAYDWLVDQGVMPEDIILFGESLGTGVAVQLAAARNVRGIVLDAPYTSIVDVAEMAYPFLPSRAIMRDRYETMSYVGKVTTPALVIHGERDQIIPVQMGRQVAKGLAGPVEVVTFPEAGHSDHANFGSLRVVNDWIDRLIAEDTRQRAPDRVRRAL